MATWTGTTPYATKNQLFSSITGLVNDINDLNISSISQVSTISATQWMSAPTIYVSDLQGFNGMFSTLTVSDIRGVYGQFSSLSTGVLNVSSIKGASVDLSGGTVNTNVVLVSSIAMKGFDSLLDLDVSFDFGLGQAIGGVVGGLGALVGGGLIAAGTGVGLAIQGAETGIATMIAPRGDNYINNNQFETINFTTQLQFSTLGGPDSYYSSIFRTVSTSGQANTVPGSTIYTSTIFPAGTACVRSVSDPFNLITGNSNLNASTIQSFGQWCPLEGLEPEFVTAQSVSTNLLSTGQAYIDLLQGTGYSGYLMAASTIGVMSNLSMAYDADILFNTGATNYGRILGTLNDMYFQTNTGFIFTQPYTTTENASIQLGSNANESELYISSIYNNYMKAVDVYASSITCEVINVVSSIFINSTSIENVTSTITLIADDAFINTAQISTLSSFSFLTGMGNPTGVFDINKIIGYSSTTYNSISSLTNNILSYKITMSNDDEPTFNMGGQGAGSPPARYTVLPTNVQQWASTIIIANPNNGSAATLEMWLPQSFISSSVLNATFDLKVDMTANGFYFVASQLSTAQGLTSSFINLPPSLGSVYTYRFNINPNGWWNFVTPAGPPYQTSNTNLFTITQDINDVNITTTDRLNIAAGDIYLNGHTHLQDLNVTTLNIQNLTTDFLSTISTAAFGSDSYFNTNIWVNNAVVGYSGDFSSVTTTYGDSYAQIQQLWMSNYNVSSLLSSVQDTYSSCLLQSFYQPTINRPVITLAPGTNNDMTISRLGTWSFNGGAQAQNYYGGTFIITPPDPTFKIYTDNAGFGLASNLQVVNLSNAGSSNISLYINFPSSAIFIPGNSAVSLYWSSSSNTFYSAAFNAWSPFIPSSELDITQSYNNTTIKTTNTLNLQAPLVQISTTLGVNTILYGASLLQPKMFRQIINGNWGAGGSASGNTQVTNGSMTFSGSLYNCQCSIASFYTGNGATAFGTVALAPYIDSGSGTWYVNWSLELNAGGAGANWTVSWNAFMFPYNMTSS